MKMNKGYGSILYTMTHSGPLGLSRNLMLKEVSLD